MVTGGGGLEYTGVIIVVYLIQVIKRMLFITVDLSLRWGNFRHNQQETGLSIRDFERSVVTNGMLDDRSVMYVIELWTVFRLGFVSEI